jgi:hypothetical protein
MLGVVPLRGDSHTVLTSRFAGLCGLVFYSYDVGRDIWILHKVFEFREWYGCALLAIMVMHHVYRGVIISAYLAHMYPTRLSGPMLKVVIVLSAPLVMAFTLVMDVWSFLHVFLGVPSPAVLGVESYSKTRSVVIATCQSLPIAVIITVIFSRGTRPSSGEYLSTEWYGLSFAGSALSMLWGLHVLLTLTRVMDPTGKAPILRTLALIMTGGLLCPEGDSRHGKALDCGLHALRSSGLKHMDCNPVRLYMRVTVLGTVCVSVVPLRQSPAMHEKELELVKMLDV